MTNDKLRASTNCVHGIPLLSGECAHCTGPMTEAELDLIRKRLVGHDGCYPKCDRAPLPGGAEDAKTMLSTQEMSPAQGARGVVLHRDDGVTVCRVTLEPGASWPEETHADETETVIVITGRVGVEGADWASFGDGTVAMVDDRYVLGIQSAFVGAGAAHRIVNSGATRAEYVSVLRRA